MTNVTPAERDALRRNDLYGFAQFSFPVVKGGTALERSWHLEAICHQLQRIADGHVTRLLITAPPRSLKSYLVSVVFPAFMLGHDPRRSFICASYAEDLAAAHSADCRRLIESDRYRRLFGNVKLVKSTETTLITDKGGKRYATSVEAALTGMGGDVLIVDDPLNSANVYSEPARNGANEWYSRSLVPRLDDKRTGAIIVVAQRLHQHDLPGYLLERGGFEHLNLPAIAPRATRVSIGHRRSYDWAEDEPLQLEREPHSVLANLKTELGEDAFNAQYLQAPVPEGGNMLKPEWLRSFEAAPVRQPSDQVIMSVDTASTVKDGSSYTVMATFLVRNKAEVYLTDVVRKKIEFPQLRETLAARAAIHNPNAILIEDQNSGTSLIQDLKAKIANIIPIKPKGTKADRMFAHTATLASGVLSLPGNAPWLGEWMIEYRAFPNGRYDDQVDALSQFLTWFGDHMQRAIFICDWMHDDPNETPSAEAFIDMIRRLQSKRG